jgi:glycerophosphoryl diester phosphodiesterase
MINRYLKSSIAFTGLSLICFSQDVEITAHRGASGLAPENTIAAINKALDLECDYSEIDVQEIEDGNIILFHDTTLYRTTNIEGYVWNLNLTSSMEIDVGSWFGDEFRNEKIPTLEEVIKLVDGKMKLNIEIKINGREKLVAKNVVELVQEYSFENQCIITSFDFGTVDQVRAIDNKIKTGYIFKNLPEDIDVFSANCEILSVSRKIVTPEFIRTAKQNHKEVHVWTVNKPEEMKKLILMGVDNIITDRPDILKLVINDFRQSK